MKMDFERAVRPFERLRQLLNSLRSEPSPEEVHELRTQTRKLEALLRMLSPKSSEELHQTVRLMKPLGKAAGQVRDMDVLIAKTALLPSHGGSDAIVQLVEHMSALRVESAKRLYRKVKRRRRKSRVCLKRCLRKLERIQKEEWLSSTVSPAQSQILTARLEHLPRVHRENLHEFRKGVRELRNILQLMPHREEHLKRAFDGVKDQVGDWHDWLELDRIAKSVLDPKEDAGVLREIDRVSKEKKDAALTAARALQRNFDTPAAA